MEGRLKLAEKERIRARVKAEAVTFAGVDSGASRAASLAEAAAQADANMMALLEEETKLRVRSSCTKGTIYTESMICFNFCKWWW